MRLLAADLRILCALKTIVCLLLYIAQFRRSLSSPRSCAPASLYVSEDSDYPLAWEQAAALTATLHEFHQINHALADCIRGATEFLGRQV